MPDRTFRFVSILIVSIVGLFMVWSFKRAMASKRTDQSELSVVAKLPEVEKWINTLPDTEEQGLEFLPLRLQGLSDTRMISWRSDTGAKWYFLPYDIDGKTKEIGYAYSKTEHASPPSQVGRKQIQCKKISPRWVRYETLTPDS